MSSNDNSITTTNNASKIKDDANNDENFSFDSNQISSDEQLSQKIGSINFSTTFEDTNTYESEAKSSTTTSRTYAQVVCGAKPIKKSETRAENPKENEQTNETQEIPPIVGRIYKLRYSLSAQFGVHDDQSSTVESSSTSSTSSKSSSSKKANQRPCLVIRKSSTSVNVLLITRFHYRDPRSEEVLPELSREDLLKYFLPIHPASLNDGRRSVRLTLSQAPSYFRSSEKSYIILKPLIVSLNENWSKLIPEYIDNDELSYIRDTLFNILMEEHDQLMETLKIIRNNSEDKDDEDKSTTSSSSSFSISRFLQESFGHIDLSLNRSKEIEQWLADVEPSPECTIDLNN
ncbi:unnamed protein product [Rotaria sp. Silwood1]|nr:unnamed protein product [Rotaria sp. Silwood1]CAF3843349.1 unnamed protein product [Rotaria sp. Silwood1]CAF4017866.1 unnamed protein product [Rotaria sp. Silwood1]